MAQAVVINFDDEADAAIRDLWRRLVDAGVAPPEQFPPHLTLAAASSIPRKPRQDLRVDLGRLALPSVWLAALSTFASSVNVLMLVAVADPELLAVHSAVHDVLAGKVDNPSAFYLPGSWMPHITLAQGMPDDKVVAGFGALLPAPSIRAKAREISIIDTDSGDADILVAAR